MNKVPGSIPNMIFGPDSATAFIVNKSTKRLAKWTIGIVLMAVLCWNLYRQIQMQLASGIAFHWWPSGTYGYFIAVLLLLPLNIGLETRKWQLLVQTAIPISWRESMRSVLGGIAASIITPNRIGEYPGRILILKQHTSTRLLSVAVLGACAQMLSLMLAGFGGQLYYCSLHPQPLYFMVAVINGLFCILLGLLYFSFERWAPFIEQFRALRRIKMWARLLHRFNRSEQFRILMFSIARLLVFSLQFWLLLTWQGLELQLGSGLLMCMLFFWALAIIPSIALAELGIRGTIAIFIFGTNHSNIAGITLAVFLLWLINLMVPAMLGAYLILKPTRGTPEISSAITTGKE